MYSATVFIYWRRRILYSVNVAGHEHLGIACGTRPSVDVEAMLIYVLLLGIIAL